MRRIFRKGFREFEFLNARETRFMEFRDKFQAIEFLREFLNDHYYMKELRRMAERELLGVKLSAMTDYGVIERVADLMVENRIRIVERYDLFETGFHAVAEIMEAEPAEEEPEEYTDEPDEVPETIPPAPQPNAAEQAAALARAAETGAPFCEA